MADLGGGAHPARAPLRSKIFSISCSFLENLTKLYVGAPLEGWGLLLQGILDPPLTNQTSRRKENILMHTDAHRSSVEEMRLELQLSHNKK